MIDLPSFGSAGGKSRGRTKDLEAGMIFRRFDLEGPVEVIPRKIEDERGYFSEILRLDQLTDHVGPVGFVQDNESLSVRAGTIRGIHFQSHPAAQGKLVRCTSGRLFDVAVDLRSESPTYGRWVSALLTPEQNNQLWIPVGFGHGFCTLEPRTIVQYRVTNYYSAADDKGVAWDDSTIGVEWPDAADPDTLSSKDRQQPALVDLPPYFAVGAG